MLQLTIMFLFVCINSFIISALLALMSLFLCSSFWNPLLVRLNQTMRKELH